MEGVCSSWCSWHLEIECSYNCYHPWPLLLVLRSQLGVLFLFWHSLVWDMNVSIFFFSRCHRMHVYTDLSLYSHALVILCRLGFLVLPVWFDDSFTSQICLSLLTNSLLKHHTFLSCHTSVFIGVSVLVHSLVSGDWGLQGGGRSCVLQVLHGPRVPALESSVRGQCAVCVTLLRTVQGVWGFLLTQKWRGHHWALPLMHITAGWCHVEPTNLIIHWSHCISRLCLPVLHLLKEVPTCSCGAGGGVHACIDEN